MTLVELINCTPHPIVYYGDEPNPVFTIPLFGIVARAEELRTTIGTIQVQAQENFVVTVRINDVRLGNLRGLPDPHPNRLYIVSRAAAEAAPERDDLLIPDLSVRDAQGRIVGCRAFARITT